MKLVEVNKIWDRAPHNAFTDLIRFQDNWYCAFREGLSHISEDGRLRVICSTDGIQWSTATLITWEGGDLRDAKLSISAQGNLMLNGAVRFLQPEDKVNHQSITWLSQDGQVWNGPLADPSGMDTWRWSVSWYEEYGYSFAYSGKDVGGCLYRTADGVSWEVFVDNVYPDAESYPNEASLVFTNEGTALCLLRRDKGKCTAWLGFANPPFDSWKWNDTGVQIGGPKLIQTSDGRFLAGVRLYDQNVRTAICTVDPGASAVSEVLALPSDGDSSYPGMVELDGLLWVSYYSSHEEKSSIYLAKIEL